MRERHKHFVDTWKESTDPLKHVFEVLRIQVVIINSAHAVTGYWHCYLLDLVVEKDVRCP